MAEMKIEEAIQAWAKDSGYRYEVGTISDVEEVHAALQKRRNAGEIDPAFYRDTLEKSTCLEACALTNPKSILVVAVPRTAHVLSFSVGGRKIETILPPTYVRYRKLFEEVRDDLSAALAGFDCRLEVLGAPLKALGNRLGLLSYGRNNIGYIDGLGSYFQLVGIALDKPIEEKRLPSGSAGKLLPRCRDCRICAKACPTGAIDMERILLHAEKCYTLFSESSTPIPEGLKSPSPKCLIGCLRCQEVCPENKGLLRCELAGVSFDEEETMAFLGIENGPEQVPDQVRKKFLKLGLTEGFPVFARNLKRLLDLWHISKK
jgi:epoxyqueuosine reductase